MSKKKMNSLEDLEQFVFSTCTDFDPSCEEIPIPPNPSNQYLEVHYSHKGRAGKTVTIIKGVQGTSQTLKTLSKMLKTKCGVGGTVKNGDIIIQGNYRNKIMEILTKEGYHVKRVGG